MRRSAELVTCTKQHDIDHPARLASDLLIVWRPNSQAPSNMPFEGLSEFYIIRMYENIRDEVSADAACGIRLVGKQARQRAEDLRHEIERRGIYLAPIEWSKASSD